MNISENSSIQNLHSLYYLLSSYKDEIVYIEKNEAKSLQSNSSIWPNLIYSNKESFLNDEVELIELSKNISNRILPPLVLIYNNNYNFDLLKGNGFYAIDEWTLMSLNFENLSVENKYKNNLTFKKLTSIIEILDWTISLSESLFSNKKLNENIFYFLMMNKCDLYSLKINQTIIGTTLVYYDEHNVAGIYMVSINSKYRGQGLGKQIMNYTLNCIQQKHVSNVVLQSTKSGLALYKSLGFKEIGITTLIYKIK